MPLIETSVAGGVASLELNRPQALNALNSDMIAMLSRALTGWATDDDVIAVVISSASDRAFCAGGDLKPIRAGVLAGDTAAGSDFFEAEYNLNHLIATYPKPVVAVVDGIAMGGGLGVSVHGSIRVVSERAVLAMPETAIGFVPDVGSSHFLPRMPGAMGRYMGLTGTRFDAGDAVATGLATHFVAAERIPALMAALVRSEGDVEGVVDTHADQPPTGSLALDATAVDEVFGRGTLLDVVDGLDNMDPWSRDTRAKMLTMSPTSLFAADELLRRGADADLRSCLDTELVVARAIVQHADFAEGVRSVLVDKDRIPRWTPLALEMVSQRRIVELFS